MLKFIDNYPLKNITTLSIGGPAKKFVLVSSQEELLEAIEYAKSRQMSFLVIGDGSNLLISDKGVGCLVIKNEITGISAIHPRGEEMPASTRGERLHLGGVMVRVKSGTPLQELVNYTITCGLSGLQKLTGIPGTVGGAVYGNAGAYGQTISDYISNVVILGILSERSESKETPESDSGRAPSSLARMTLAKKECHFNYRDSVFKKNRAIILEVIFQLEPGDPEILKKEAEEILSKRLVKYPPGIKCPGSFFKNLVTSEIPKEILEKIPPEKIIYGKLPAGALLESVGAKGQSSDGVAIADYHANLFINQGSGTAKAFYNLAKTYALKVKEKFGITLEPEVQLINLPPLI